MVGRRIPQRSTLACRPLPANSPSELLKGSTPHMNSLELYDATLRDGMQGEGMSLSAHEKVRVAQRLDELGVHLIEAGFPARTRRSSSSSSCSQQTFSNGQIAAFGKRALPRRTFLRGVGVALALPLLDAMVPALSALADTPAAVRRRGSASSTCRTAWRRIRPASTTGRRRPKGRDFEMSQILTPLAPFRDRMLVVSGLDQNQAEAGNDGASGDHTRGTSSWLTGVHPKRTEGADVRNGVSADQIAAPVLGKDTALPSLELAIDLNFLAGQCENSYSCAYLNTLAWTSPTTPLPTENNPRVVFERLFGDGGTAERRAAQARRNQQHPRFGARRLQPPAAAARARRSHGRRTSMSTRCARSSGGSRASKSAATTSCRRSSGRQASPNGSTSTSS